jgi:hypothetical protein
MRFSGMIVVSVLLLLGTVGHAVGFAQQSRCPEETRSDDFATRFVIHNGVIRMPAGAFLLVRKDGHIGAIRLTSIDPNATQLFGKSTYESLFQKKGSPVMFPQNAILEKGKLDVQDLRGPGRGLFIHRPSGYKAQVGKWKLDFKTPDSMWMSDSSVLTGRGDHGFEFAPTSACTLSEISASDNRLRWFRFDPNTQLTLPLNELPK